MKNVIKQSVVLLLLVFSTRLAAAQDVELQAASADLKAVIAQQGKIVEFSISPAILIFGASSPDAAALSTLNDAATGAAGELRASIDLYSVYENLKCESDKTIVKPLLEDRLRMYARLLDIEAEKAAVPIGVAKQQSTTKQALQLRDDIKLAKNKIDALITSLN
jgi:hypothetical protein